MVLLDSRAIAESVPTGLKGLVFVADPVANLAYSLIRGPIVGWYPYPFIDPRINGHPQVVVMSLAVVAVAGVVAGVVAVAAVVAGIAVAAAVVAGVVAAVAVAVAAVLAVAALVLAWLLCWTSRQDLGRTVAGAGRSLSTQVGRQPVGVENGVSSDARRTGPARPGARPS